tara:strand:+ start:6 stop:182 length:177 start_codon:yes stop_codon:yes gene_type:complete
VGLRAVALVQGVPTPGLVGLPFSQYKEVMVGIVSAQLQPLNVAAVAAGELVAQGQTLF